MGWLHVALTLLIEILELRAVLNWYSSQFKNNRFTEICCGAKAGSDLRLIDSCITQLEAQGPSRTCDESKEEEEEEAELPCTIRSSVRLWRDFEERKAPEPHLLQQHVHGTSLIRKHPPS